MIRYGLNRAGLESLCTDNDLARAGLHAGKDGLETAVYNLLRSLRLEKSETKQLSCSVSRFRFLLSPAAEINSAFRSNGLSEFCVSSFKKAVPQDLRAALEKEYPILLRLRHDPSCGTRYVVCWGAECTTGGEAGDRWKFFISDGKTSEISEIVLWDLKDAQFMRISKVS
ncbi:MAG: hypothetical protein Q4B09_05595 [Lachnospiraceae bacterium]|nr:hypothetical protein [Lachnospiraceae bacterium]